jgi:uncharacterized protein YjiS (DUF1127 family)
MSATTPHLATAISARPAAIEAGRGAAGWVHQLSVLLRTLVTRRQLEAMDARMLRDIGLTRSEALAEAGRAPWDVVPLNVERRRGG